MTLAVRRMYYGLAMAVFVVVAPLVVLRSAGYTWHGWRQGFVRTGVLVIDSTPHAMVVLNGQALGQTPKRLGQLTPGVYDLALEVPGYNRWQKFVRVEPNTATLIGPVFLFHQLTKELLPASEGGRIVHTGRLTEIFSVGPEHEPALLQRFWPSVRPDISFGVWSNSQHLDDSPNAKLILGSDDHRTVIWSADAPTALWVIQPLDRIFWTDVSDQLFYGLRQDTVIEVDALTKQEHVFAHATSASYYQSTIWFTLPTTDGTSLYHQAPYGGGTAAFVASLPGQWQIISTANNALVVRNSDTKDSLLLDFDRLSGQLTKQVLGSIDTLWPTKNNEPLLWSRGLDLLTLTNDGHVGLLTRSPREPEFARWLEPGQVLIASDGQIITIQSTGTQQGRTTLSTLDIGDPGSVIGFQPNGHSLVLEPESGSQKLLLIRW